MFFANILLTTEYPLGRMHPPSRPKADWYHSISVFTEKNINDLEKGEEIACNIIHFYGVKGGPVLDISESKIKYHSTKHGKKLFVLDCYKHSYGVIGVIKTKTKSKPGFGKAILTHDEIKELAELKWGGEKIPYAHNRKESYNCVGFTDDILHMAKHGWWNKRVEENQKKFGLYVEQVK